MSVVGPAYLGRYAVQRRIGSGGFATVWLAYDDQLDAPVAVKVLADNWTEQHEVRSRFVEEGRYLRRVDSPHVVPAYDAGVLDDGRPFLVMGYADQGTLADRLAAGGVTVPQALEVVAQVGAGLQALHDRGILHRDLKPANVLFRTVDPAAGLAGVRAMVGDLGLGKALDVSSRLTMIAGTPAYVAPEQARGDALDARADQYSLGVLTYLLLAGRLPWVRTSLSAAADGAEPDPLSTPERRFPDRVERVVTRALAPDRDDRWPTTAAFVAALTHALAEWTDGVIDDGTRVLPVDPQLTVPGERPWRSSARLSDGEDEASADPSDPSGSADGESDRDRAGGRRRRVLLATGLGLALAAGGAGGLVAQRQLGTPDEVTVVDESGAVAVTVPASWDEAQARDGWRPPNDDTVSYAALSVGQGVDWAERPDAEGVFVGVLPGSELPDRMPRHRGCDTTDAPTTDTSPDATRTVVRTGCGPAEMVLVERVVQVDAGRLLWVQVRAADRATANRVLDGVDTFGL